MPQGEDTLSVEVYLSVNKHRSPFTLLRVTLDFGRWSHALHLLSRTLLPSDGRTSNLSSMKSFFCTVCIILRGSHLLARRLPHLRLAPGLHLLLLCDPKTDLDLVHPTIDQQMSRMEPILQASSIKAKPGAAHAAPVRTAQCALHECSQSMQTVTLVTQPASRCVHNL